jgi:hypothetical protein
MATKYWLGSTSSSGSSWNVAGNWSGSGVPAAGDIIYLNSTYTTQSLTIDVSPTIGALYTTGYTSSITLSSSISLTISGSPGDIILNSSMSWTASVPGSNTLLYQGPVAGSGSVNFNNIIWPGSFRPTYGFKLTGSMVIANDWVVQMAASTVPITGSGSVYCNGNLTNGGSTLYTYLSNIDFYLSSTSSANFTIGANTANNTRMLCKNFYISGSNNTTYTIYGLSVSTGLGLAATATGSFEYTTGGGLRLASFAGTNGQLAIDTAVASQMCNIQVNNKTNPSDRIQFDPSSVIVPNYNAVTPENFTIMSDIVLNNNSAIQIGTTSTITATFNSYSGSKIIIKEGTLLTGAGGASNYNGTVTCSFEGPSTFLTNQANSNWRLPIIFDSNIATVTFSNISPMPNYIEYKSGKIYMATDKYFYLSGTGTFLNANKASIAGGYQFLFTAATTTTMNEFPSGTPSKPVLLRTTIAGSNATINLVDGLNPSYLPVSASYKVARNIIASNITVTGKPVYIYGKIAAQITRPFYASYAPYLLSPRNSNIGIRFINEMFYGRPVGNATNITTNIGGSLTRNIGAMFNSWGNGLALDPTRI